MSNAIASGIDALQRMTTNELLERYAELHGQPSVTVSSHATSFMLESFLCDCSQSHGAGSTFIAVGDASARCAAA